MGTAANIIIGGIVIVGGYYLYKNPQYVDQFFTQLNVPNPFTEISNWFNNGTGNGDPLPEPEPEDEEESKDEKKSKMGSILYQSSEYPVFRHKKLLLLGPPYLEGRDYPVSIQGIKTDNKKITWRNDRITWNSVNPLYLERKRIR